MKFRGSKPVEMGRKQEEVLTCSYSGVLSARDEGRVANAETAVGCIKGSDGRKVDPGAAGGQVDLLAPLVLRKSSKQMPAIRIMNQAKWRNRTCTFLEEG